MLIKLFLGGELNKSTLCWSDSQCATGDNGYSEIIKRLGSIPMSPLMGSSFFIVVFHVFWLVN